MNHLPLYRYLSLFPINNPPLAYPLHHMTYISCIQMINLVYSQQLTLSYLHVFKYTTYSTYYSMSGNNPQEFIKILLGRPVTIGIGNGITLKGILASVDGMIVS